MCERDRRRLVPQHGGLLPDGDLLRDRQHHRHAQLAGLLNKVQQWLTQLRGIVLEVAPPVSVDLKAGETLNEALNNVRSAIVSTKQHLAAVGSAPLPQADQKRLAAELVERLARTARPTVAVVRDQLKVSWRDDIIVGRDDLLTMLAWVAPEQVRNALEREIDVLPTRADALPAATRMERVAELEAQLLELERREESLICRAAGDGLEVLRRPDAAPLAVLGLSVGANAQAQQVA